MPGGFGVSPTFNVSDLKLYVGEEDEIESRTTLIQEGEDDENTTPSVAHTTNIPPPAAIIQGPLTRARARELNYEVNLFLAVHTNASKDWMLLTYCDDFIILRNLREDSYKHKCNRRATAHKSSFVSNINSESEIQTSPNSNDHNS